MSTIKANDLQTTTGGIPTVKGQRLIPTAWVNWNQESNTVVDSENISSVTDRGEGLGTLNFATAMDNNNYTVVGNWLDGGGENDSRVFNHSTGTTASTTQFNFFGGYPDPSTGHGISLNDASMVSIIVLGGQA